MSISARGRALLTGIVLTAGLLPVLAAPAHAQSDNAMAAPRADDPYAGAPSGGEMTADLLIVRPLSLAATVLGTGLFVVSLPFALLAPDGAAATAQRLVVEPARYTFARPLGVMEP